MPVLNSELSKQHYPSRSSNFHWEGRFYVLWRAFLLWCCQNSRTDLGHLKNGRLVQRNYRGRSHPVLNRQIPEESTSCSESESYGSSASGGAVVAVTKNTHDDNNIMSATNGVGPASPAAAANGKVRIERKEVAMSSRVFPSVAAASKASAAAAAQALQNRANSCCCCCRDH